ncbi:MAG: hypothetical protein AVDCRST_MAG38-2549 [uncultured Solirubrobacteraceae bacterium]|uniref:Uncharacterized protein n=1 Tax=uncultured Solirubrobacteraceae bacterium TaxID=1162706 RepID=A0A6J4S4I5_9ACTN|nr:MAG: hypothetical protein AVDCRST_MAG38-2549 [uncultured Solirubrobacteraceae bacterium]
MNPARLLSSARRAALPSNSTCFAAPSSAAIRACCMRRKTLWFSRLLIGMIPRSTCCRPSKVSALRHSSARIPARRMIPSWLPPVPLYAALNAAIAPARRPGRAVAELICSVGTTAGSTTSRSHAPASATIGAATARPRARRATRRARSVCMRYEVTGRLRT